MRAIEQSVCTRPKVVCVLSLAVCWPIAIGCGGDADAINTLERLNDKLLAKGGTKAVRMKNGGDSVG